MPLFRYANIDIDSYATTAYDGKLRLKLTCFAGGKRNDLLESYIFGDLEVIVQQFHDDSDQPRSFDLIDVRQDLWVFSGTLQKDGHDSSTPGDGRRSRFFLNVLPSTTYRVLIYGKGQHIWKQFPDQTVRQIPYKAYHKNGKRSAHMVIYFR